MTGTLTSASAAYGGSLDYLLNRFVDENPGVGHAAAVSGDGLPIAVSNRVPDDVRDQMCATASGLTSLGIGMAGFMRTSAPQTIVVTYPEGWVLVLRVSDRLSLMVFGAPDADMGVVHHSLGRLGEAVGTPIEPGARVPA